MMRNLRSLLDKAQWHLLTEDEENAFNNHPSTLAMMKELDERSKNATCYDTTTIGEYFSRQAHHHWNNEKSESIEYISDYIETSETCCDTTIIGFIGAWTNSEIQHPIIEKLVKHTLKNNLLKYPLNTTVRKYLASNSKKPSHAPKKDVIHYLDTLMTYFEVRTINGTSKRLSIAPKSVREHLKKLVAPDDNYQILLDESFIYYNDIQLIYNKWINYKNN